MKTSTIIKVIGLYFLGFMLAADLTASGIIPVGSPGDYVRTGVILVFSGLLFWVLPEKE
jgi:hypothetical protein